MTNDTPPETPSRTKVLLCATAFWLSLGLCSAILTYTQETPDSPMTWRPQLHLKPALNFLAFVPASMWLWFASRPLASEGLRAHWRRLTGILLLTSLLVVGWQAWLWRLTGAALFGGLVFGAMQLVGVLAVGTGYHAMALAHRRQHELLEAQLRNLRGQLQPHALFNTLQAIGSTAERDGATAARMISLLGDMLRHSLEQKGADLVALGEELVMLDPYLQLQQLRFADRLRIDIDVPDSLRRAQVPDLLLQPLVENALQHGIERRPGAGSIQIRAHRDGAQLHIEVADDGLPSTPAEAEFGTGLHNTAARLRTLFGERASLQVQQNGRGGTTARLRLPYHEVGDAA
ncbi:MAG: histidine kinase [Planctomycetes bacterium]|nr:histidine kinase [Planctomycetota bacterium]MCC7398024.1 histidine kinase [Planctomycetota bacterium]